MKQYLHKVNTARVWKQWFLHFNDGWAQVTALCPYC